MDDGIGRYFGISRRDERVRARGASRCRRSMSSGGWRSLQRRRRTHDDGKRLHPKGDRRPHVTPARAQDQPAGRALISRAGRCPRSRGGRTSPEPRWREGHKSETLHVEQPTCQAGSTEPALISRPTGLVSSPARFRPRESADRQVAVLLQRNANELTASTHTGFREELLQGRFD